MGKVYPSRASFSQYLPSRSAESPEAYEGQSPRNPPRISISAINGYVKVKRKPEKLNLVLSYWTSSVSGNTHEYPGQKTDLDIFSSPRTTIDEYFPN